MDAPIDDLEALKKDLGDMEFALPLGEEPLEAEIRRSESAK